MEETCRRDLNQSWEAIDIKTGHQVLIPKGSHQAIRMLLKDPRDQTDENYLVVMVKDEGKSVLAGLREAYWRQWEGHYIPEFRVTIREMKEKPHPPLQRRAHDLCLPKNSLPGSSLDNRPRHGRPFL